MALRIFGLGTNGAVLESCISLDGGQNCATSVIDTTLSTATATETKVPGNYPSAHFAGWSPTGWLSGPALNDATQFTVNVSGHTVTWVSSNPANIQFYIQRSAGTKLQIAGTSPGCPDNLCTVVSYNSPTQITIAETVGGTVSNTTMRDRGTGFLVWLKNTGGTPSASVSFTFDYQVGLQQATYSNPNYNACGLPITDIKTDKNGNPYSDGPKTGFLCSLGGYWTGGIVILWIPSLGEARLMSSLHIPGRTQSFFTAPPGPFSATDPKTIFVSDAGNNLWKGVLNQSGTYIEWNPGTSNNPPADNFTWTNLGGTTAPILTQLESLSNNAAANWLRSGVFSTNFGFWAMLGGSPVYKDDISANDAPCIVVRTDVNNQILRAFTSWDHYPLRWGRCHFSPLDVGTSMFVITEPLDRGNIGAVLGGPYLLHISQLKSGPNWKTFAEKITGGTNANPAVLTSASHGMAYQNNGNFLYGAHVTISGATGAWAAINGEHRVIPGDANTFQVVGVDSRSFGSFPSGVSMTLAPPLPEGHVESVVGGNPAVINTSQYYWPFFDHGFQDGDPVAFSNFGVTQTKQFYAKRINAGSLSVYKDATLTQPTQLSDVYNAWGGQYYYAENCPADTPTQFLPGRMFYDAGAIGIRCVTIRVKGEPCSDYAGTAEHNFVPCKADPANTSRSGLQDLAVGDFFGDWNDGPYREGFVVLKKTKNSETDIELTAMRFWGQDTIPLGPSGTQDQHHGAHWPGWTPLMIPSYSFYATGALMDFNDPSATASILNPQMVLSHFDMGAGSTPGTYAFVDGAFDPFVDLTIPQIRSHILTTTNSNRAAWAGLFGYMNNQSYPSHRQNGAPLAEQGWAGDFHAILPGYGSSQTTGSQGDPITLTSIRGTTYDSANSTSIVYKITNPTGIFSRKLLPYYAWSGYHMLRDISGPGSLITDNTLWSFCVADFAGECRPSSAQNEAFVSVPYADITQQHCVSNSYNVNAPCLVSANPLSGYAVQNGINPVDTTGTHIRRLTTNFAAPGTHWTFSSWLQTPWVNGAPNWGFFVGPYINGLWNKFFAAKLPPWPTTSDNVNRSTFVSQKVTVASNTAFPFARVRFGYAENGPAGNFYCTARQEACSTEIPTASPNDPYSFVSESATHQQCGSGCTINLPAIPGRVLYYVIDRLDARGTMVTNPMQVIASP
jgi:hypothetical protein